MQCNIENIISIAKEISEQFDLIPQERVTGDMVLSISYNPWTKGINKDDDNVQIKKGESIINGKRDRGFCFVAFTGTLREIIDIPTIKGHAVSQPMIPESYICKRSLNGKRYNCGKIKGEVIDSTQIGFFDFDSGVTRESIKNSRYGPFIAFTYPSMSFTPEFEKFRAAIIFSRLVDKDELKLLLTTIRKDIGSDSQAAKPTQLFYGSRVKGRTIDYEEREIFTLDPDPILEYAKVDDYEEKLEKSVSLCSKAFKIRTPKAITYCLIARNLSNERYDNGRDFVVHACARLKGGPEIYEAIAKKSGLVSEKIERDLKRIKKLNEKGYKAMSCRQNNNTIGCKHRDECHLLRINPTKGNLAQMMTAQDTLLPGIISLNQYVETEDIKVIQGSVAPGLKKIESSGAGLYLNDIPTGGGKTKGAQKAQLKGQYATSTHELIAEFNEVNIGHPYPVLNEDFPEYGYLKQRLDKGFPIAGVAKQIAERYYSSHHEARVYLDMFYDYIDSDRPIATHKRLAYSKKIHKAVQNHKRVIIDEDIFMKTQEFGTIDIAEVYKTCKNLGSVGDELFSHLNKEDIEPTIIPEDIVEEVFKSLKWLESGKFLNLITSQYHYLVGDKIKYLKSCLPKIKEFIDMGAQVILLSDTPLTSIYKAYLGEDNVTLHKSPEAEIKANVIQYWPISFTMSKSARILNDSEIQRKMYQKYAPGISDILTHKATVVPPEYNKFANYGNVEGFNYQKGKPYIISGTYRLPAETIIDTATVAGIKFQSTEIVSKPQIVRVAGYQFQMRNLFEDDSLRNLQLEMMNNELVQALGRVRPGADESTDVSVVIFSDVPVRGDIKVIPIEIRELL